METVLILNEKLLKIEAKTVLYRQKDIVWLNVLSI